MIAPTELRGLRVFAVLVAALCFPGIQAQDVQPPPPDPPPLPNQHDCSLGCVSTRQPVCGSDGVTYASPCVAHCQGLLLQHDGPCSGDVMSDAWAHADWGSEAELVPADQLERFADEDFHYAARVKLFKGLPMDPAPPTNHSTSPTPNTSPPPTPDTSQPPSPDTSQSPTPNFVRVTKEGQLYVSTSDAFLTDVIDQGLYEPAAGAGSDSDAEAGSESLRSRPSRSLMAILGTDDRISCPRYPTYPFSAVGQVLTRSSTGLFICSGTLIGPDVVLTAAHCVFNRKTNAFLDILDFVPARYRSSYSNDILSPYGAFPWTHVTLYSNYMDPNVADANVWDIAVIKLASRVGELAGWMGIRKPCGNGTSVSNITNVSETWIATTAGYPVDKPSGSCVTTQCQVTQDVCDSAYLYHDCDTYEGQSGSAMWAMSASIGVGEWSRLRFAPYVRAVHNLEWTKQVTDSSGNTGYVAYINSAVAITPLHYAAITSWISSAFANGEPETKVTWYPLPQTMVVSTSLYVTDTAASNVTSVNGATYAPVPSSTWSSNTSSTASGT